METRKVIIIGTGPAGLTAAIYTARADLKPLVLEGHEPGGQLTLTTEVENFPGFEHGVLGPELMSTMKKQASRFGAEFLSVMCTDVDFSKRPFTVRTSAGHSYLAETVIVSTGASAKWPGLPNEKELTGRGVSTCATCDGFFYRDKIVHVVGGGDTAMEDATFITKFAKKVYVGSLYINGSEFIPNAGDVSLTFTGGNNVVTPTNVTDLVFAPTINSADVFMSVVITATTNLYANFHIKLLNKSTLWDIAESYLGDETGVSFTITTGGQVQYTSASYPGFASLVLKFRTLVN